MEHGFKWLNNLTDRLFNKYTPKGISAVLIALILQNMGASDELIEIALKYEWNFITDILTMLKPFATYIYWVSIVLIAYGGFLILKRNHDTIQLRKHEIEAKALMVEADKSRTRIELAKLECELHGLQCSVIQPSAGIKQLIADESAQADLTRAMIERVKADLELIELQKQLKKMEKNDEV
jgi:hypothetical protein